MGFVGERVIKRSLSAMSIIFYITYVCIFEGQWAKPNRPEAGIYRRRTWSQTASKFSIIIYYIILIFIYFIELKE